MKNLMSRLSADVSRYLSKDADIPTEMFRPGLDNKGAEVKWAREQLTNPDLSHLGASVKLKNLVEEVKTGLAKDQVTGILSESDAAENWSRTTDKPKNSARYVLGVQAAMHLLGYKDKVGEIDALWGNRTQTAVKAFQEKWNADHANDQIDVDGIPGSQTIPRMLTALGATTTPTPKPKPKPKPTPTPQPEPEDIEDEETTSETQFHGMDRLKTFETSFDPKHINSVTAVPTMGQEAFIDASGNVTSKDVHGYLDIEFTNGTVRTYVIDKKNQIYWLNNDGQYEAESGEPNKLYVSLLGQIKVRTAAPIQPPQPQPEDPDTADIDTIVPPDTTDADIIIPPDTIPVDTTSTDTTQPEDIEIIEPKPSNYTEALEGNDSFEGLAEKYPELYADARAKAEVTYAEMGGVLAPGLLDQLTFIEMQKALAGEEAEDQDIIPEDEDTIVVEPMDTLPDEQEDIEVPEEDPEDLEERQNKVLEEFKKIKNVDYEDDNWINIASNGNLEVDINKGGGTDFNLNDFVFMKAGEEKHGFTVEEVKTLLEKNKDGLRPPEPTQTEDGHSVIEF